MASRLNAAPIEKQISARVEFTPKMLAEIFADMSDEQQAQFFIDLAEDAKSWPTGGHMQWYLVGRHLATCSCSTYEARELVAAIARGADQSTLSPEERANVLA